LQNHFFSAARAGGVKPRQPLCGLILSDTIFRIFDSTAVPSSESVVQFQPVQRAAAIKEASVAAVAAFRSRKLSAIAFNAVWSCSQQLFQANIFERAKELVYCAIQAVP